MAVQPKLVEEFLAEDRIAVAGVSRSGGEAANLIYRKLKSAGREVYAINPRAEEVEGDRCYPSLGALPVKVGGVVIATPPEAAEEIVGECAELGIGRVWMHRSFGRGSVSEAAVARGRREGIAVLAGGCPMMFCEPVDLGHRCMRWILGLTGRLPSDR